MKCIISIVLSITILFISSGCKTDDEVRNLREQAYNKGYYDAIDCVKRKGGAASRAADICENE